MKTAIVCCTRIDGGSKNLAGTVRRNKLDGEVHEFAGYTSMGAGYNAAIRQIEDADVFVFTHDDVSLMVGPDRWNEALIMAQSKGIGFVGVAGTTNFGADGVWWAKNVDHAGRGCVFHQNEVNGLYASNFGCCVAPVVVLDGVCLIASRKTLEEVGSFPEDTGFHFYDIEITFRAHLKGLRNFVMPIPLVHYSVGDVDWAWKAARMKFMERYSSLLPAITA